MGCNVESYLKVKHLFYIACIGSLLASWKPLFVITCGILTAYECQEHEYNKSGWTLVKNFIFGALIGWTVYVYGLPGESRYLD